jgi:hypothetical protein
MRRFDIAKPSAADVALAAGNISIACPRHKCQCTESIILSCYFGWNEIELDKAKTIKVKQLDDWRGRRRRGVGDTLWEESCTRIRSLLDDETLEASLNA